MNPTAKPFVPRSLPIKEEEFKEETGSPTDTKLARDDRQRCMYVFRKDSSLVESIRPDQDSLYIQRKQAELSEMIFTQQARSLLPSHKLPTFSGDAMSYPAVIAAFETLIESKVLILVSSCISWISTLVERQRN